jgi:pimeloyl-ACP methyl ester carboxylesterase
MIQVDGGCRRQGKSMKITSVSKNYQELLDLYAANLDRLTVPCHTHFIDTSYGRTHVISAGPEGAKPVFILHGAASHAIGCWPLINGLASKYRVHAPDAPRQLGKSDPFRLSSRNADYGKWLTEVLDKLGIEDTRVVGFSFGGWMACKLAINAPDRIEKLVLLSPVGLVPFRFQYWLRAPALFFRMLIFRSRASIRKFAGFLAGPTASQEVIEDMTVSAQVFLKNFHMQDTPHRLSNRDLKKIGIPTMLLVGAHDTFFDPEKVVASIRDNIPEARTDIIEDMGHVIYFENPELVNARILEFFE